MPPPAPNPYSSPVGSSALSPGPFRLLLWSSLPFLTLSLILLLRSPPSTRRFAPPMAFCPCRSPLSSPAPVLFPVRSQRWPHHPWPLYQAPQLRLVLPFLCRRRTLDPRCLLPHLPLLGLWSLWYLCRPQLAFYPLSLSQESNLEHFQDCLQIFKIFA